MPRIVGHAALAALMLMPMRIAAKDHKGSSENAGATIPADPALRLSAGDSHVRIKDARLRQIIEGAAAASPTLHDLVTSLQSSDVVAYVEYDTRLRTRLAGHLSFVSSVGNLRYVMIRVAYLGVAASQAASVGHELRHAVEVSQLPAIGDVSSFEREFARIGFANGAGGVIGARSYETHAAQDAGDSILRELQDSTD